jgi:hypothetical protein
MNRILLAAGLASSFAAAAADRAADAHAIAGARVFPVTLTIDDPGVADEASIPTFSVQRQGATGDLGPTWQYNLGGEFDKRITENFGLGVNGGYTVQSTRGDKTRTGFLNIGVTAKYQTWVDGPHEAIVSLGVIREFGRTGTSHIGADQYGSTTPTAYFGKGFGDLSIPALRPFAVTGTFGYTSADKKLKAVGGSDPDSGTAGGVTGLTAPQFNNGASNRWVGGLSLQYSLPYLRSQVRDYGLPEWANRLTPLVEIAWSSPASKPTDLGTQLVFAPGVIYQADTYQLGVEALIPANRASGRNVGFITQLHLFFDDLFPNSLGKPLLGH